MYATLWEFVVRAGEEAKFEELNGSGGAWAALFQQDSAYLGTELLRSINDPRRYVTIDRWQSAEHYRAFRQRIQAAYQAVDAQCEPLTESERSLGEFEL